MNPASGGGTGTGAEPNAADWRTRAAGGTEYSLCRAVLGGTGTTLLALRLSRGAADEAAGGLHGAALHSLQNTHPVLRAHLRGSPSGPTLAFPSSAPTPLPLAPHPAPESAPDFHSLLERELNCNPWAAALKLEQEPDAAPVLFASLYELPPPAGGAALFVRIHTAACDSAASAELVRELVALLGGAGEEAAVDAALEERIPQRDTWKPFWARGGWTWRGTEGCRVGREAEKGEARRRSGGAGGADEKRGKREGNRGVGKGAKRQRKEPTGFSDLVPPQSQ